MLNSLTDMFIMLINKFYSKNNVCKKKGIHRRLREVLLFCFRSTILIELTLLLKLINAQNISVILPYFWAYLEILIALSNYIFWTCFESFFLWSIFSISTNVSVMQNQSFLLFVCFTGIVICLVLLKSIDLCFWIMQENKDVTTYQTK